MSEVALHIISLVIELITLGLFVASCRQCNRMKSERDEAIKHLMTYMDKKTREIIENEKDNSDGSGSHAPRATP